MSELISELAWQRKTFKIGNSIAITIPEEIAKFLKIIPKDKLIITVERKRMVIVK